MHQQQTAFENIVEKEEIPHNEQFLLFPQYFKLNQIIVHSAFLFVHIFDIISLFAAEFEEPKIGMRGKGLRRQPEVSTHISLCSPHRDKPKYSLSSSKRGYKSS